jgi:DNA polymerase I-like protein with 3'-5' exonuclease and polymerase domains
MHTLTLDTETDIYNNGNPFDPRNKLVRIGYLEDSGVTQVTNDLPTVQQKIDKASLIVGFNFKFDYHWLGKYGCVLAGKRIWDCQAADYILSHQQHIFPSLDDCCVRLGLGSKLDIIKSDYWDRGITTSDVPLSVLDPYLKQDIELTHKLFKYQWDACTPAQRTLILLDGDDMHTLVEMEREGLLFNEELCKQREQELDAQIETVLQQLAAIYPEVPINFNSNDDLSAFLYGGRITQVRKVPDGFYKTGIKAGQIKFRKEEVDHTLPALYKPVRGSELKKAGFYATNEPTLRKLAGNKKIVGLVLELAKLDKINGTYYKGIPKINKEMNWPAKILHSNFNTTQTRTGRLSSNKP